MKEKIISNLLKLSILIKSNIDSDFEKEIEKKRENIEQEYFELENKEIYLAKISKSKKQKEKEIKKIDKILNDKKLLIDEYEKRNENLPLEKKIFSIRVLKNIIKEERENLLKEIDEYNQMMNPKLFLKRKNEIEQKLKYIINFDNIVFEDEIRKDLVKLQKNIIKCMYLEVKKINDKNSFINLIYKYRYYNFLPIESKICIYDMKELKSNLKSLTKAIVDKALEMKIIIKISNSEQINYRIIEQLLLSKIICLEDINIKITKEKDGVFLTVFDEEIEDIKIKLENVVKENINIKFNKKIKLFI